jgi:hypothetical protein
MSAKKIMLLLLTPLLITGCKVSYNFSGIAIDYTKTKTIKINFIDNRARYVNPQLSPKLTDKIQQKITSQTKLVRTSSDDAHLQLSGYITDESISTSAITSTQAATNRLTVAVHITLKNTVDTDPAASKDVDVSRSFDFSSSLSLEQAEAQLFDQIINGLADDIFNQIFSSWK